MRLLLLLYYIAIYQQRTVSLQATTVHIFRSNLVFRLFDPGFGFKSFFGFWLVPVGLFITLVGNKLYSCWPYAFLLNCAGPHRNTKRSSGYASNLKLL